MERVPLLLTEKMSKELVKRQGTASYYSKVLNEIPIGRSIWLKFRSENSTTYLRLDRADKDLFRLHGEKIRTQSGSAEKISKIIQRSPYLSKSVPLEIENLPAQAEGEREKRDRSKTKMAR
jgi:hypothetical protein